MGVSLIIPALNEEAILPQTLRGLRSQRPAQIIVVDGGSSDDTVRAAAEADLVVRAERGRARQMNLGAAQATGDVLMFLHADCQLEMGGLEEAERLLRRSGVAAGCFRMRVLAEGRLYRWIDAVAAARVTLSGVVYGDQGLFLRRELFDELGGFPAVKFLEDVLFSRRLGRVGRVVSGRRRIGVSPRRWQQVGLARQTIRNWTIVSLAALGVAPDRLAGWYPNVR
jgi:rSAM/selenodomain-associated transferase 2